MHEGLTFMIAFNYQGTNLEAVVTKIYAKDTCIFKLSFPATEYIFVKTYTDWLVVSDFAPCETLKKKIITVLSKHLPLQTADNVISLA